METLSRSLDSFIGILSPETAMKRLKARISVKNANRWYDGATRGRRADGWRPTQRGLRENQADMQLLRERARDFERNNGYYKKAVGGIVGNTIGTGIVLQYKEGTNNKRRAQAANEYWREWHDTTDIDWDGIHTGAGLQSLAFQTLARDGEVFIRRRYMDYLYMETTGKIPLKIQILAAEFLDTSKDSPAGMLRGENQIISGIEFDPYGRRVAYHLYREHPTLGYTRQSMRVPASDVIHLFRQEQPGQIRGVPWGSSVYLNLKDLDGYEDAELMRRKIAACFAGFITEADGDNDIPVNGQAPADLPPLVDRLEPGILETLPNGKNITFATPPNVTGYAEYATSLLHKIAAGFEIPYSVLTGDYSQVNFSSGRMGWLEFQRKIDQWRWNLFIPTYCDGIRRWFTDTLWLMGESIQGVDFEFTAPRREMIDPLKEITAITMSVKAGLLTMQEAIKESGYEPMTNIREIEEWNKLLDEKKITLDSDPRKDPKRMLANATAQNVANKNKKDNTAIKSSGEN